MTGEPKTVLLTGANGWLGRFLALELLERAAQTGGTVITVVRGRDEAAARARLEVAYDSGDPDLLKRFRRLAADHLEVIAGDIGEPKLGLGDATWDRLVHNVDQIVHPAALVNHVLPYSEEFGPNVVGTAEIIRLAITAQIKPVTYLSTVAVAMSVAASDFVEDGDIRDVSPVRPVDSSANGYANSKWAGGALREAHDLCGLPVAVFRSDMILAHTRYAGQLNVPDAFTRLVQSVLVTGIAPRSFYERDADGRPQRAHYDGLLVDFVAESIVTLAAKPTDGYRSFDVMNPRRRRLAGHVRRLAHRCRPSDRTHRRPRRLAAPLRDGVDCAARRQAPAQRPPAARRVPQAGAADPRRHRTGRRFPRRRARGGGRRRRGHPPHHAVVDRQVRGRPRAPGLGLTEGVLGCQACRSQRERNLRPD